MAFSTKILLATDGSKDATLAAQDAIDLSDHSGAELHVVYVGHSSLTQPPTEYRTAAQERLDELVTKVEDAGVTVAEAHLRMDTQGSMEDENIVGLAEELGTDLIVIGSQGLSRMKRLLMGSVSERVVRLAHCPVLVMRH
jgi:nucleotide-binding universal stress UspA family protein